MYCYMITVYRKVKLALHKTKFLKQKKAERMKRLLVSLFILRVEASV